MIPQDFEHRETKLKARAACNLSCLYLLEGEYTQASTHATLATSTDKYSAAALVSKVWGVWEGVHCKWEGGYCVASACCIFVLLLWAAIRHMNTT